MSSLMHFTKMHGLGNDFVVIDAIRQSIQLTPEKICFIADRHRGIGCDQVLLVESATDSSADFFYRIYNADGSEVGQCGNGARCLGKFIADQGLSPKKQLRVKTNTAMLELTLLSNDLIRVNMGAPRFIQQVMVDGVPGLTLSMGNPHLVFLVEAFFPNVVDDVIEKIGRRCHSHPLFPEGVNVGFMQIINQNTVTLRVYERGVGETQACGSGACAAAVAGIYQGRLDTKVTVMLPGGSLEIEWQGKAANVFMAGPAATVFEGRLCL